MIIYFIGVSLPCVTYSENKNDISFLIKKKGMFIVSTMCIVQFIIVMSYALATSVRYCYEICQPKKFRMIEGDPSINKKYNECVICFETMESNEVLIYINKCHHTFHFQCLKEWNNNYSQTCPTCRGGVGCVI
jgi:hypothetical protein